MKSEKIWNKTVALKLFFFCSFEMDFWSLSLFVVFVALRMFLGRLSLWKYFLALFSLNFFRRWSLRKFFLLLLLWKLFLAPVALKNVCRLPLLKWCFCSCRFESYFGRQSLWKLSGTSLKMSFWRSSLWKFFFGTCCFENSILALVDFWKILRS